MVTVVLKYHTGLAAPLFDAAELHGGGHAAGLPCERWSVLPLQPCHPIPLFDPSHPPAP
jgi:hypothetical protein